MPSGPELKKTEGTDVRLRRSYEHSFPGFGAYNFTSQTWPAIERRGLLHAGGSGGFGGLEKGFRVSVI